VRSYHIRLTLFDKKIIYISVYAVLIILGITMRIFLSLVLTLVLFCPQKTTARTFSDGFVVGGASKNQFRVNFLEATHPSLINIREILGSKTFLPDEAVTTSSTTQTPRKSSNINYRGLISNSLIFLGIEHGYRISYEERTRVKITSGPFFKDWYNSVKNLSGWRDGNRWRTNNIFHPMQGSVSAFIFAQNDRVSQNAKFWGEDYWRAIKRQLIFSAIYSTQFELGPISEASLGNVGLNGKGQTYMDHFKTPLGGIGWKIAEDAGEHYITCRWAKNHRIWANIISIFVSPTKSLANVTNLKKPWHREACPTH
jgi:hypothetical protein